jgi:polyisoprenoid-binding protein YceI
MRRPVPDGRRFVACPRVRRPGTTVALFAGVVFAHQPLAINEVAHMTLHHTLRTLPAAVILAGVTLHAGPTAQTAPLAMDTARVTIAGTSNIHTYSAWSDTVRVTGVRLAATVTADTMWDDVVKPGGLERFEVAIPVATLTSRDAGLDKNMYKALKAEEHRDITFRLTGVERSAAGALMGVGKLRIAGVEREVVLSLATSRRDATLVVTGRVVLLMTDFGIKPPTAMLGMLKTDPKVTVTFETVLSVPRT